MIIKGIGETKAITRRRQAAALLERPPITDNADIAQYLQTHSPAPWPARRDPEKKALQEDAVSIVLSHNHLSGNLRPSRADEELTHKIKEAAKYFDIKVLDHIDIDMGNFKDLLAYKKSYEYFSYFEKISLTNQIRRSPSSVCANLVEGNRRSRYKN